MVESKFVVLQMIPHTLFIEWDFRTLFTSRFAIHDTVYYPFYCSWHCSLAVLLFMTMFTSRFTVY